MVRWLASPTRPPTRTTRTAILRVTNGLGQTITVNTVNARGQPTQVTDANGIVIDLVYDGLGRLTSATVDPGANHAVMSFQYNAIGQITQVTLPNDVVLAFAYNAAGRLTSITNGANEKIEYTYDNAGNITEVDIKDSGGTIVVQVRRTYDELSRLLRTSARLSGNPVRLRQGRQHHANHRSALEGLRQHVR